ncbi:MAG: type IX secretion system membrane protein PorP/SprF [Spirochaetales bacterium]|jgi:type IX secretion system PorP/SprF family membrane protein|nr:type IX secretion system membrane protein PorP/SprF [Spirochaetales bacterium]
MKHKKQIALLSLLLLLAAGFFQPARAQQDPMYTQYMDNLLVVNPGYAGSKGLANFMVVARNQWVSFEGAPRTRTLSFHTPLKGEKIGLGFSIMTDRIGPLRQTGLYFDYSYSLRTNSDYKLNLGLKGGFSFYRAALTELSTVYPDPIYERDIYKNFLPNFGVGAFLYSDDTYFGLSAPKLIENIITREDYQTEYVNKEEIHLYLMAGKKFLINETTQLKTHSMLRLVKDAPISLDVTALVGFKEKFWVGGMLRFGDSYGFIAQFKPLEDTLIGYSYDLSFSGLNAFNNGTHEIMLSYNLNLFE